jgi:prepilin-type N-terminal cleavage/methylation domain-containing protein
MNKKYNLRKQGFTLIEILVVIGIIAILAAVVLVAINPGRQFAQARNSQRISNVNAILNAVSQNSADNRGVFTCTAGNIPATSTPLKAVGGYNIRDCVVPNYLTEIPLDPSTGINTSPTTYDTGYTVAQDSITKRVTINARGAELGEIITVTR